MDPATFTVLAEIGDASVGEGLDAVTAAYDAFQTWSVTPARVRAEVLRKAFEIMTAEIETCARIISLENGKAWRDALGEATYAAEFFRWFSEEASRIEGGFRYAPGRDKTIITDHRPMGVAYMITPWNFPAAMATRKLAPALAAGCTAILKPASETPLTALWIADRPAAGRGARPASSTSSPPRTRATSRPPSSPTPVSRRSRSPARPTSARCCSSRRPTACCRRRWSSAATRRSSSSRAPTSTRPSPAPWWPRCATAAQPAPRRTASTCTSRWSRTSAPSWRPPSRP